MPSNRPSHPPHPPRLFGGVTLPGCPDPENVRRLDLLPIPQLQRAMRLGIAIDREHFQQLSEKLDGIKTDLAKQISSYVPQDSLEQFASTSLVQGENDDDVGDGIDINVESCEQMAELLYNTLGIGAGKQIKRTASGRMSTGKKELEKLKQEHPAIPLLLRYREASKLKSTYTDKLPIIAVEHRQGKHCAVCGESHSTTHYRVHTQFLSTRTDTSRMASKWPNLQNIPARTALGREVRLGFVAVPGRVLISSDYAQVELRLLADQAREQNMLRIFRDGGDIHTDTAMRAFAITDPSLVDPMLHRAPCKNVNFGVAYGLGPPGLFDLMAVTFATAGVPMPSWLTMEWCEKFIQIWFGLYPEAKEYFDLQYYRAKRYQLVWTPFGWVRLAPEVTSCHPKVVAAGLRQSGNLPIQGFAAGVMKLGMARVEHALGNIYRDQGVSANVLLTIHDELVSEVDEEWAEEVKQSIQDEMGMALYDENGVEHCRARIKADAKIMQPKKDGVSRWAK